jgi:GDP-D-mannose dehydratase
MPERVALITGATGQDGAYHGAWHKALFVII